MRKHAAGYARYSTDKQTENSIAYQRTKIEQYCRENELELASFFADEAESGTNTDREGFRQLVAAAARHEFDVVVIYEITRGSRDVGDWFDFRKKMMMLGIQVVSTSEKLGNILDPNDFLVELLSVGMGQRDVLETRKRSRDGVAVKAQQGVFLGGCPPLGYDIRDGQYIVNDQEAAIVRSIFEMYAAGASYDRLLSALPGVIGKRGRPLGKNSFHSILRNERYIGVYSWNKRIMKVMRKWAGGVPNPNAVRIENAIPPIIDRDLWERVQKRMNDRKHNARNKAKREYLLAGLIECVECGGSYVGHASTSQKGYETRYYVCGNKYRTHACHAKNIPADKIETFVVQNLKEYLLSLDFSEAAQKIADSVNGASPDLSKERAELASIQQKIANGVKAVLSGMQIPELEQELAALRVRKDELEDIIARRRSDRPRVDPKKIEELFDYSIDHWDSNLKEIIQFHVQKIYAQPDGSFTVNVGVHLNGCGGWT